MMGRLIVLEAWEDGRPGKVIGGKKSPFPVMASILPHTRDAVANELVVVAPVFAWSGRHEELFRDERWLILSYGMGLNHVDWKLVYTNRTRSKIMPVLSGLVIQAGSGFDGSMR
jgi:hypothetical protein